MKSAQMTYPDLARVAGTGLLSTGLGLILFVVVTVLWGDPFTRISEGHDQQLLKRSLASQVPTDLAPAELDSELTLRAARLAKLKTRYGAAAGIIEIPDIKIRKALVHGARDDTPDLTKGPGIYQQTAFPGTGRPLAIAGHRTTYGAPFLDIDKLRRGDPIIVTTTYGKFTYRVTRTRIIGVRDWSILDSGQAEPTADARARVASTRRCELTCEHLVLTACHPKYSASRRIAVFAKLSKVAVAT